MVAIPPPNNFTVDALLKPYTERGKGSYDSYGIAISLMGQECDRMLWYMLRWASWPEIITAQKQRRFDTGNLEEERLLNDLREAGFNVESEDPATGAQFRIELAEGWLRGKMDGTVQGLPEAPVSIHVVECKSHNDKSFKELKKKQLKAAKYDHWVQCQLYMFGKSLLRCLYVAVNKNDDELYAERVKIDTEACKTLEARALRIVRSNTAPGRISEDPEFYLCKWCNARAVCHEKAFARNNCRTCMSASFQSEGKVFCELWKTELDADKQRVGCEKHLYLPALVPGEQVDANEDLRVVTYLLDGKDLWIDGPSIPS